MMHPHPLKIQIKKTHPTTNPHSKLSWKDSVFEIVTHHSAARRDQIIESLAKFLCTAQNESVKLTFMWGKNEINRINIVR